MGRIGDTSALRHLVPILEDPKSHFRYAVVFVLDEIAATFGIPVRAERRER
ncbi:MAG: hypothetical protein FJ279_12455 [Planctomycetes bacterium]|nr:hypothetical protein [Planctomycetota bacterium]MBM4080664.1 hypothetical protein [Planctomycetota bacterium]